MRNILPGLLVMIWACAGTPALSDPRFIKPEAISDSSPRTLAVISDLHMGVGMVNGRWHDYEDFRWDDALQGLLNYLSGQGDIDLVIAGDFLELWQLPNADACKDNDDDDAPLTQAQIEALTREIVNRRQVVFAALREFVGKNKNRLYVIPGNHDAALLLSTVWDEVGDKLGADEGLVSFVESGIWISQDERVVIEHGHQIGNDANRYDDWPTSFIDPTSGLIQRPWGEEFVQELFNETECEYSIIDNLSPESVGARYRMADRGLWGTLHDVARFVVFNLFETSLAQKAQFLGPETEKLDAPVEWDLDYARHDLSWRLVALALPAGDRLRIELLADSPTPRVEALRVELAQLAADPASLADEQVAMLCDQIAIRGEDDEACIRPTLGYLTERLLVPRDRVIRTHLDQLGDKFPKMTTFIYGHTHQLEKEHLVTVDSETVVEVLNTGAFQRVMDEEDYLNRLENYSPKPSPSEGLRFLTLEDDFPPCYTVVIAPFERGRFRPKTWRWFMPDVGSGERVEVGDARCHW